MAELRGRGFRIDLPVGWEGEIYPRPGRPGTTDLATLHAANFVLPRPRGDFGSGAVEAMGPGDVLVVLFEYGPESLGMPLFSHRGLPLPLDPDAFDPQALQRPLPGQGGLQGFFTAGDRAFCLYVVLGSFRLRGRLVGVANTTLSRLRIGAPAG